MEKPCPVCQGPVARAPVGRPATFCSPGCRRSAEYSIRRLDRWLDRLQERRLEAAIAKARLAGEANAHRRPAARAVLALIDEEIQRAERRLRELMDRDTTPTTEE